MKLLLPDDSELELPDGASGLDAARAIGPKLAEEAVLVRSNGRVLDLREPLSDGQKIKILTTRDRHDPDALAVLRHSTAHLLAEAVRRLHPDVKLAIGPPTENGFYYDFEFAEPIHEEDLHRIEAEIRRELAEGRSWTREEVPADEARRRLEAEGQPYKVELVDTAEGPITFYTQGDFTDLCKGPHLQDSRPIEAVKLTGIAGAYWRGDERNPQLTRIYGTAFYSQDDLDAYLERLEEARKRDHRRFGPQLDLFHWDEHSPGAALWHPKGMVLWNLLEQLRQNENARRGFVEVKTPLVYDSDLWETSGHWQKFRHEMFAIPLEDGRVFALKPMNCPGHMLLFGSELRSYRDLPIRYAEATPLHRDELAGALHGLIRARLFTQDDGHVFCTDDQAQGEIDRILDSVVHMYGLFGVEARAELSTRPDGHLGAAEQWDRAEDALRAALDRNGMAYVVGEGEGTFYGPKIDLHIDDSLGRSWQTGTIQLDFQMPTRFGLTYVGSDNHEHVPVVIHRAILGALERFLGIYIEHVGGEFPLWLAPVQVAVVPVGEAHDGPARELVAWLRRHRVRAELSPATETVGKRVRAAELQKIPYVVVWGDRESLEALSVRDRAGEQSVVSAQELAARATSATEAALGSPIAPEVASGVRA